MVINLLKNIRYNVLSRYRALFPLKTIQRHLQTGYMVEREMEIIEYFNDKEGIAIDVGANLGLYSYVFSKNFAKVYSFEPIDSLYKNLIKAFANINNIKIFNIALSNHTGEETLYVPKRYHGWSTLEKDNPMLNVASTNQKISEIKVELKKLDEYNFDNISFIKIDVEGHELKVLEGAVETIKKNYPVFLIEVEERHGKGSIESVVNFITKFGYKTYYYFNKKIHSFENFNIGINETMHDSDKYIYNFIFIHESYNLDKIKKLL